MKTVTLAVFCGEEGSEECEVFLADGDIHVDADLDHGGAEEGGVRVDKAEQPPL